MTKFVKNKEIKSNWLIIDGTNLIVGRLAVFIANTIRGKNKASFTPHMNHGDFVIVKNVEKIKFTGSKYKNKKYYRHTGYPGGIKETTPDVLSKKKPEEILKLAVKRMLPGGVLSKKQMSKLKIYKGEKHPHEIQNPKEISFREMNKKNVIRTI